jgi:phytanoyl-CoA hydroxylase
MTDSSQAAAFSRLNTILHQFSAIPASSSLGSSSLVSNSKKFKYTAPDSNVLSNEQREFYEKNGFIVVKRVVPEKDLEKYRARFLEICNGQGVDARMTIMRDIAIEKKKEWGENAITKLQDWHDDERLFEYCKHPAVMKYVNAIIGPNTRSIHTMLINKPPDVGLGSSRHPPHQDLWYFPFRPAEKIVCSWTAMQKIDKQNGCLFVQPGTHKGVLLKHEYPNDGIVNKAYHGIQNMTEKDSEKMLHLEMEPGDTVFFHPLLIHGSGRNNSKGYRKAISCHYCASDVYFEKAEGTIQEELAKELEDMAKQRMAKYKASGVVLSFHDIWRLKSRHISGKDSEW